MKNLTVIILSSVFILYSATVPLEKAKKVAENYYGHYCSEAAANGSKIINVYENKYEDVTTRYTFEFDKGFVIVTADNELYPILGYSDHGKVPSYNAKGGQSFKEWFKNYDEQIVYAKKTKYSDENSVKLWKDIENNVFPACKSGIVVDRLVETEWGVGYPWNASCPLMPVSGIQTNVGCVASVMAQILKYHRWPDIGTGSASYTWEPTEGGSIVQSADFASHAWNYDLMPETVNIEYGLYPQYWETGITQAEKDEMSLLAYWTGLSVDMQYGTETDGGSAAFASLVDNAFLDHWKASSSVFISMPTPPVYGTDPQYNTIKAELDAKRPWFWAGTTWAFILDGYRDDYWYHFNWGFEGNFDGWFHRSRLIPSLSQEGDYTDGQIGITYVPATDPYTAWPAATLSGSLLNGDDVSLNWTACSGAIGYNIYRTFSKITVPYHLELDSELIAHTTGLTYSDYDLPEGYYSYFIITVYPDGESHNSNSFSTQVVSESIHPEILNLKAEPSGRTSIDLTWVEPFVGIMNTYEDFEHDGAWPAGWIRNCSYDSATSGSVWDGDANGYVIFANGYPTWYYGYRIDGWFTGRSSTADRTVWILSPSYDLNTSHYMKWWVRFRWSADGDEGGPLASGMNYPEYEIVTYAGTFDEVRRESNIIYTSHAYFDENAPENIWAFEETANINYSGTARVGFRCPVVSSCYSLGFDKIVIASTDSPETEDCTGYEIYRNGSLAATISGGENEMWFDTNFIDGENTYYIKALYPTGTSLPSEYVTTTIDANPKPDFLSGYILPATQANLSWYAPYHNPPKWYAYFDPHYGTNVTTLGDGGISEKRTRFVASDLGYYYPITLDSVGAVFYDENGTDWGGEDQFKFQISYGYGTLGDTIPTILHTSSDQTAVHNTIAKYKLPTPLVITQDFNIEVLNTSGNDNPTNLMKLVDKSHSYNRGEDESYFWSIVDGDQHYEWAFLAYITSSEPPPIVKSGETYTAPEAKTRELLNPGIIPVPYTGKALDHYKIYRDGTEIGTSTVTYYTDTVNYYGETTYYVTAYYTNPPGESDHSNEIYAYGIDPPPQPPNNIVISYSNGEVHLTWDEPGSSYWYNIYSSDDPYGTYTFLATSGFENEYTFTPVGNMRYFYITASSYCKEALNAIEIKAKK